MGEAAEWEIWRRHGIDISDDGHLSKPRPKKRRKTSDYNWPADKSEQNWSAPREPKPPEGYVYSARADGSLEKIPDFVNTDYAKLERAVLAQSKGTTTMDTKELINLMQLQNGASLFKAYYLGAGDKKSYTFKNVLGIPLEKDNIVVVETRDTLALVQVTDVNVRLSDVGCSLGLIKHLVCKVSRTALDQAKAREADAEDKLAAAEVYERLEKYQKQLGKRFESVEQSLLGKSSRNEEEDLMVADTLTWSEVGKATISADKINPNYVAYGQETKETDQTENERRKMKARGDGLATYAKVDGSFGSVYDK